VTTFLNKHLLTGQQSLIAQTGVSQQGSRKVLVWKVNIFNMRNSRAYDAVISIDDLVRYYEMEHLMK